MTGMSADKSMQSILAEEADNAANAESKGCTANVVLIVPGAKGVTGQIEPTIFCANAGDSRAVLGTNGRGMALSIDHKPTHPTERLRIMKAGSFVNTEGRVDGNLNLSRAIGDLIHKKNRKLGPKEQAISAFPDIKIVKMT